MNNNFSEANSYFKVKTRETGVALRDKGRVYFCAHPEEFAALFEELSEDILKAFDCAIYYEESQLTGGECGQSLEDLEQMNIIVIPVTAKFLVKNNKAREKVLPYAEKKGIPVLPILVEAGLEDEFNRMCGNLHFLDKHKVENEALSYEKQLIRFLQITLASPEYVEKIKNAFDGYFFLSYRKKDRAAAKELMKKIHMVKGLENIGIWYDEFLMPGRNFENEIAEAMRRCDVFSLAVTPNILEEGNYVMTREYPYAKELGKLIVPLEAVRTDVDEIRRSEIFRDMPDVIETRDETEFAAQLDAAVRSFLPVKERNHEHRYLMGMAFMNGIDAEYDKGKGLELLKLAAKEDGIAEAYRRVVAAYETGDETERDYDEAIRWQEKLVEDFDEIEDVEALVDKYENVGRLEEARSLIIEREEQLDANYCILKMGPICDKLRLIDEAEEYYKKSVQILEKLADNQNTPIYRAILAHSYRNLAHVFEQKGNYIRAEEIYNEAVDICEKAEKESGLPDAKKSLVEIYNNKALLHKRKGENDKARELFQKALKLGEELIEVRGLSADKKNLANSYINLGVLYKEEGQVELAKELYEQAITLYEEVAEENDADAKLLIGAYNSLANLNRSMGKINEAKEMFENAIFIGENLSKERMLPDDMSHLAIAHHNLGLLFRNKGKAADAEKHFLKALELFENLAMKRGMVDDYRNITKTLIFVSEVEKDKESIIEHRKKAVSNQQKLAEMTKNPEDVKLVSYCKYILEEATGGDTSNAFSREGRKSGNAANLTNEERAGQVYEAVYRTLKSMNLKPVRMDEENTIYMGVRIDDVPFIVSILSDPSQCRLALEYKTPIKTAQERHTEMSAAVSAVNDCLSNENYKFNPSSGEVSFRMASSFADSVLGEDYIKHFIVFAFKIAEKYNRKLVMLADGTMSIEQFIEEIQK